MQYSIITICLNESNRISKTINSVLNQSFNDYEYIIQDGGSSDGTREVVEKMTTNNNKVKLFSIKDAGLYDAMNKAVQNATGDYIVFLNAGDTFYNEDTLKTVNIYIHKNSGKDIYYGDAMIAFPDGTERAQTNAQIEADLENDYEGMMYEAKFGVIHQAVFARKETLTTHSFDTAFKLRAELNWYYDCILEGYAFSKMDFLVCKYDSDGLSNKAESIKQSYAETCSIISNHGFDNNRYKTLRGSRIGHDIVHKLLVDLLALKIRGIGVGDYLNMLHMKNVAIYGYGEIAIHLIQEIINSGGTIQYIVDKKPKRNLSRIRVITPDEIETMGSVDTVIITAASDCKAIKETYFDKDENAVSLEDIITEMWQIISGDDKQEKSLS